MERIILGGEGPALAGRRALLCFMEQPQAASERRGLAVHIGAPAAIRLQRAFLETMAGMLLRSRPLLTPVGVGTPDAGLRTIGEIAGPRLPLWPQGEGTRSERMARAAARAFSGGAERVLIVGTDTPDLPLGHCLGAARRLDREDVVLGPSRDGGCYLIGLRRPAPGLFRGVDWGGVRTLQQAMTRVRAAGLRSSYLPVWSSVRGPEGLRQLRARLERAAGGSSGPGETYEGLRAAVEEAAALLGPSPL